MKRSVRRWLWVVLPAMAAGVAYGGWRLERAWRYRTALVEIREQIQAGRHGAAARNLAALLAGSLARTKPRTSWVFVRSRGGGARRPRQPGPGAARLSFAVPAILGRAAMLGPIGAASRRRDGPHQSLARSSDRRPGCAAALCLALLA